MSEISDALAAARTIIDNEIAGVSPENVYDHPAGTTSLGNLGTLPVVILSQSVGIEFAWQGWGNGQGRHDWEMFVAVYLRKGDLNVASKDAAVVLANQDEWIKSMADVLRKNMTLNGTVTHIGDGDNIFRYLIGFLQWNGEVHYGIIFRVPITQNVVQTVSA